MDTVVRVLLVGCLVAGLAFIPVAMVIYLDPIKRWLR